MKRNFAVVASNYHSELVEGLITHFKRELETIAPGATIFVFRVPGSFEIPLAVQEVAARGGLEAIAAFGVIIEGETAHARLIGETITGALMRISLSSRIPVVHEVLLVKDEAQARVRCLDDALNRGTEAARVATGIAQTMAEIGRA